MEPAAIAEPPALTARAKTSPSVNPGGMLRGRFGADRSGTHTIVTVLTEM